MTSSCTNDIRDDNWVVQATSSPDPYNNRLFCLTSTNFRCAGEKRPQKPDFCSARENQEAQRERPMTDPPASITRCAQPGVPVPGGRPGAGACPTVARTEKVRATVPPSRYPPGGRPSCRTGPSRRAGYRSASTRGSGPGVKPAPGPRGADLTRRAEWRLDACGPGRQASAPRRPASGPAASAPGNGVGAHGVTARDHPAPAPAGLPLRQGRAARQPPPRPAGRPRGLTSSPRSPGRPPRADVGRRRPGRGRT